jgi:acetolactate synthase I/II/III large subunit
MEEHARTATARLTSGDGDGAELTGAEAVALVLAQHGVETVFAYPGTSEIALCDAVATTPDLRLVLARGDKESAFMASGASLLRPNRAAAILHGARGLTNATGAVAAARRNELGTLFVVGLPSTGSAPFLPPHGEPQLIDSIGRFTQWCWEAPAPPPDGPDRARAAIEFVDRLHHALTTSARLPARPSMVGVPQDVAEMRWVPASAVRRPRRAPASRPVRAPAAVEAVRRASRPLLLVDDYALRYPGVRGALAELADLLGAPIFQVRYRRGPMLFERLRREEAGTFLGWFDQFSPAHAALLDACDLLVTVEDRNVYARVFGPLPTCRKLAINGDAAKVRKNGYLGDGDVLVEGDVTDVLRALASRLPARTARPWFSPLPAAEGGGGGEQASPAVEHLRTRVVGAIGAILREWDAPVLVDDSQMFGGMISERYDLLPPGLRVFGDHGGFVGGGLATSIGLAITDPRRHVLCTLGDQGFVNSFQALVTAVQERAPVIVLVCNNGGAVSLQKQAGETARPYLRNTPGLSYHRIAEAIGARTWLVDVPGGLERSAVDAAAGELRRALAGAAATAGPALVELRLPADPGVWSGIWLTRGFDERAPATDGAGRRGGPA